MKDNKQFIFPCLSKCNVHKVCASSERCEDYQCELLKWRKEIAKAILEKKGDPLGVMML